MIRPLFLIAALVALVSAPAAARDRVALLIGNGAYEHTGTLRNPTNDVFAMYALLTSPALGFDGRDVEVVENGDRRAMARAIRRFRQRASQADTALLFFSGHGMEIGGRNYLIPTDAELKHPGDAEFDAIALDAAVAAAASASRLSVVIFDACRNNSFPSTAKSGSTGFRMVTPDRPGQVIAFSTAPQQIAFDGAGALSPYTQALTEAIAADPSLDVRKLFTSLGAKTARYAGGPQRPFARFGDLPAEDIALIPAGLPALPKAEPAAPEPTRPSGPSAAEAAWAIVRESESVALLERFRTQHPNSPFDADALAAIERLRAAASDQAAADRQRQAEVRWRALEASEDAAALQAFIDADPIGPFADAARERLIALYKAAQGELKRLGLYKPAIDGDWGPSSQSALRAFQRREKLSPADGLLTAALLERLRAAKPALEKEFRDCPQCPEMVSIPGGSFTMGSPSSEPRRSDDEGPQRRVTIQPFAMGKYEVTRGEFARFVRESGHRVGGRCYTYEDGGWKNRSGRSFRNPGFSQSDRHPAVCVSWEDAQAYVRWLNTKVEGDPYRLPSEAELEYAIRAKTSSAYYWGSDQNAGCRHANGHDRTSKRVNGFFWIHATCDDGHAQTAPVGSFRGNGFGLHDTVGNVWEWAQDCWNKSYSGAPSNGSAWMSGDCSGAVLRGGSWFINPWDLRSALRFRNVRGNRVSSIGFRVARVSRTLR